MRDLEQLLPVRERHAIIAMLAPLADAELVHQRGRLGQLSPFVTMWAVAVYGAAVPVFVRSAQQAFEGLRSHIRGTRKELDALASSLRCYRGNADRWIALAAIGVQELNSRRWSRIGAGDWQAFDLVVWPQSVFLLAHTARSLRSAVAGAWDSPLFDPHCGRPLFHFGLNAALLINRQLARRTGLRLAS